MGILGAAGQMGQIESSAAGNIAQIFEARRFDRKSWERYKKSLQRGPSWWREGLRRAGINPLYAISRGSGPGTYGGMGSPGGLGGGGQLAPGLGKAVAEAASARDVARARKHEATIRSQEVQIKSYQKALARYAAEREREKWRYDMRIWKADGYRLRRTQLEREALLGGGNPVSSAADVLRSVK